MASKTTNLDELRRIPAILSNFDHPQAAAVVEWAITEITTLRTYCEGLSQRAAQAEMDASLIEEIVEAVNARK